MKGLYWDGFGDLKLIEAVLEQLEVVKEIILQSCTPLDFTQHNLPGINHIQDLAVD